MAWTSITWLKDNEVNDNETFNCVVDGIFNQIEHYSDDTQRIYLEINKTMAFDEDQIDFFNGDRVEYTLIRFTMDFKSIEDNEDDIIADQNISTIDGFLLIFKLKDEIHYIINRPFPEARKMLRNFRGYENKGEITEIPLPFSSDFFLWIVYHVYNEQNKFSFVIEADEEVEECSETVKELNISRIIGLRGTTPDQNSVTANGNKILNLISTLAFLLETKDNDGINRVIIRCSYTSDHDKIELRLDNGKLSVEMRKYQGKFKNQVPDLDVDLMKSKLLLLIYLEILPNLQSNYDSEKGSSWVNTTVNEFTQSIKDQLLQRIDEI